jgi:hypothetical protein
MLLLFPDSVGPLVSLGACLDEMQRSAIEELRSEEAARTQRGVPLVDDVEWGVWWKELAEAAMPNAAPHIVADRLRTVVDKVQRRAADVEPKDFSHLNDVHVRFVAVAAHVHDRVRFKISAAMRLIDEDSGEALFQAWGDAVSIMVKEVRCLVLRDGEEKMEHMKIDDAVVGALARNGVLVPLARAALEFQNMPTKKALRFGQSPPLTSAHSSAPTALDSCAANTGATAAEPLASQARSTSQTNAHDGI